MQGKLWVLHVLCQSFELQQNKENNTNSIKSPLIVQTLYWRFAHFHKRWLNFPWQCKCNYLCMWKIYSSTESILDIDFSFCCVKKDWFPLSSRQRWQEMRKLCSINYSRTTTWEHSRLNQCTVFHWVCLGHHWLMERKTCICVSQRGVMLFILRRLLKEIN